MGRKTHPSSSTISIPCQRPDISFEHFRLCSTYQTFFILEPLTFHSYAMAPIPAAAPDPAIPMKCPLPMLLANSEAPT